LEEAYAYLKEIQLYKEADILCRIVLIGGKAMRFQQAA